MALVVKDRVQETTVTVGTIALVLAGAVSGFQSFSVIGDGNTTYYAIVGGAEFEVGLGTYTLSGTLLSRDTILESSNGGTAVNFSAGTKNVFVTYPAEKGLYLDASGNAIALGTPASATLTNATGLPISTGVSGLGTGVATFLATPSSANLASAITDETGSGALVFGTSPTIASPTFTSQSTFAAGTAAAPSVTTTGDTNTGIFFPVADTIAFAEGGAEAMRIDSSGNVGIGTTSPTGKLCVGTASSGNAANALVQMNATTPSIASGTGMLAIGSTDSAAVDKGGVLSFHTNTTSLSGFPAGFIAGKYQTAGAGVYSGYLQFATSDAVGTVAEQMRIDASGNLLFNSGYGSVATAYGCRAWINFNGTGTIAIRASGGVTSITDNGTGSYTVTLSFTMPDANYSPTFGAMRNSTQFSHGCFRAITTTTIQTIFDNGSGTVIDPEYACVAIFR